MNWTIKQVLTKLEKKGYEAYITGGFVRDYLLGSKSFDVDICTNAKPKELIHIFPNGVFNGIGGISFKIKKFNFEITTYRRELKYENRKPVFLEFIDDLLIDIKRRDFTINAFIMDKQGKITDYLTSYEDLNKKIIKIIGDIEIKLKEDPLRILRSIRFAANLNFKLETKLYQSIKKNYALVATLSNTRIKDELDKILLSNNPMYGLNLLKELGILNAIDINYSTITPVKNLLGMYAQLEIKALPFTKKEKTIINDLKSILKDQNLTKYTIYKWDISLIEIAADILRLDIKEIRKKKRNLPIKNYQDIKITAKEITKLLNISYDKTLNIIYEDLANSLISGKIKNTHSAISTYLINNQDRWHK